MKPLEVVLYCRLRCHGNEKLGSECTQKIYSTHTVNICLKKQWNGNAKVQNNIYQFSDSPPPVLQVTPDLDDTFHKHLSTTPVTIKAICQNVFCWLKSSIPKSVHHAC